MKRAWAFGFASLTAAAFAASPAVADVITTTGQLTVVTPPPSVVKGADPSNTTAIIFEERSSVTVPTGGLRVDIDRPGVNYTGGSAPAPGTIAAGTAVESYLVHADPVSGTHNYIGTVTFNSAVLGIEILTPSLVATDGTYGHPGTSYDQGLSRGLESSDMDFLTLSSDRETVSINFTTSTGVDDIRIFTAVPEPSSFALAGVAALATAAVARSRKRSPRA